MKRLLSLMLVTVGVLAFAATPAGAAHGQGDLTVALNGANEVGTPGDRNGSGRIHLEFFDAVDNPDVVFPGQHYVCYELTFRNVDRPVAGLHIHEVEGTTKNPRKDAGPVVVDLLAGTRSDGAATCVAVDEDTFDGILDDPREYYVNLHNAPFPAGAIRGQLHSFS